MNGPCSLLKSSFGLCAALAILLSVAPASATTITIEPDDYAPSTELSTIQPGLLLRVYDSDSDSHDSTTITPIRATTDLHPSTGIRVFSRNGISSFSDTRQLDMNFTALTDFVSIDFIGSSSIVDEVGILEIYDAGGTLLDTYTTAALGDNEVETMSFTRGTTDIKFARAYTAPNLLTLGRLDNLSYNNLYTVPEPATLALVGLGIAIICGIRRRHAC
jgi:hypothetical protein